MHLADRLQRVVRRAIPVLGIGLTACPDSKPTEPAKPTPVLSTISVALSASTVAVGQSVSATASGLDQFGAAYSVGVPTWSSSNPTVAGVNAVGTVIGLSVGSAQITAVSGGKSGSASIAVIPPPVASVSVSPATANVIIGQTQQLTTVLRDAAGLLVGGRTVTWSTSDPSKATVSSSGLVTAVAVGSVTITATSEGRAGTAAITVLPLPVASVTITPSSASLPIGGTQQLTASTWDAANNTLTGRTVTWTTSDASRATVSASGLVTGITAGTVSITATSEGKSAAAAITVLFVPVASVTVAPASSSVLIGGTATLVATPKDASGNALPGKTFTWTTSSTSIATGQYVGSTLVATGVGVGTATFTATSEGRSGTATVTVSAGPTVSLTAVSPAVLTPGTSATITGTNFSSTPSANAVSIGGVAATVTAASATQLTVMLSAAYPCQATQNTSVSVTVAGSTGTRQHPLQVATQLAMTAGQRLAFLTDPAQRCNELSVTGGRYIISIFNTSSSPSTIASFTLRGAAATTGLEPSVAVESFAPRRQRARMSARPLDLATVRAARAHLQRLERERAFGDALRSASRRMTETAVPSGLAPRRQSLSVPTTVGSAVTVRYRTSETSCTPYTNLATRVVASTAHAIALEDNASPTAGLVDAEITALVNEFETKQYALLQNFGDINAYDTPGALDNPGRVIMVFTPRVNALSGIVLGFAATCDLYPVSSAAGSNQTKVFWARVPTATTGSATTQNSKAWWAARMPGTLVHEAKHILQYVERLSRGATFEESWLEEALAQVSDDIYSRSIYAGTSWKGNTTYASSVFCDHRIGTGSCPGAQNLMANHFDFLYDYFSNLRNASILMESVDYSVYGGAWMFARWLVDQYGGSNEATFLRALTQTGLTGVTNVIARSGQSFGALLADWTLAMYADDDAALVPAAGAKYTFPSWNLSSIWTGFNGFTSGAYSSDPLDYLMAPFGNWTTGESLYGGGAAMYQLSGSQSAKQLLDLSALPSGSPIRMSILRIQ